VENANLQCPDEDDQDRLELGWETKKEDKNKFLVGRAGDDLMVSFECDYCIFQKLHRRTPTQDLATDKLYMACIRRVHLDGFWSRAKRTEVSQGK
jgi:hypothetical protein